MKTEEIIEELAKEDAFFKTGDTDEKSVLSAAFRWAVWEGGPHIVTILNREVREDVEYNRRLNGVIRENAAGVFNGLVSGGTLYKKLTPERTLDWSATRLVFAFADARSAAHFSKTINAEHGADSRVHHLTDAGPDERVFTPH